MSNSQSTISSNTLFHFTKKIETVISILKNGFKPHFHKEDMNFIFGKDSMGEQLIRGVPMVCFCDIPLSQAKNHMKDYGSYGIGLSKDWGIKKNISPVLYAHNNSEIIKYVAHLYFDSKKDADAQIHLFGFINFLKQYEGKLRKNGDIVRFYDEREWRFVNNPPYNIFGKKFHNTRKMKQFNDELRPLEFEPQDIKYIIISNHEDIKLIRDKMKEDKKYEDEIDSLLLKVISAKMIEEDV